MKIAFRAYSLSVSAFVLMVGVGAADMVRAEDALTSSPPPQPALNADGLANSAQPHSNPASALGGVEDKIKDSAKDVIKQLGSMDNVSLEDLNTARLTVVKLDALIDIEKHLAELDKLHNDKNSKSLASAIPMSALGAPSPFAINAKLPMTTLDSLEGESSGSRSEVARISGTDGHYTAEIQGKTVRVGDHLADGRTVVAISANQVSVKAKGGVVHELKVKDVDEVFGHGL